MSWAIERERKGYAIHNAEKNQSLDSFAAKSGNGGLEVRFDDLLEERVECWLMKRAGRDEFEGALNDVKSEKHSLVLRNVLDFLLQV